MHLSAKLLISLVGVLLLAILAWVLGPFVPALPGMAERPLEAGLPRLGVIGALLAIWLVAALVALVRARRTNAKLVEAIADPSSDMRPGESAAVASEAAVLAERMDGAVELLRRARLGKGREFLYQLPWYILIGPPGSGKTTALVKSGLKFPFVDRLKRHEVRGVGGTRNCDWLFTDDAVLIDTAGRYTTQDSNEPVDSAGWGAFLRLLKETRPRQPINGAVVAVGLDELAGMGDSEREECARAVRRRILELNEQLGIRFPVYMMFTKADLIAGFVEFMGGLSKTERSQVWGMTFPLADMSGPSADPMATLGQFGPEFDLLVARLETRVIERLQQETDTLRRGLIFSFPRQIASLKEPIEEFLAGVFQPSRLEEPPILRGVYLTSGTQEGTPIDRIMATLASLFGLEPTHRPLMGASGGRSYFLADLFEKVIFAEAGLVGRNLKGERARRMVKIGAAAAALAAVGCGIAFWTLSYFNNRTLIAETRAVAADYTGTLAQVPADPRLDMRLDPALRPLDRTRALAEGAVIADARRDVTYGFGLYQGGKLETAGRRAYARALEGLFRPRLLARLEEQIRQNLQHGDYVYEALKVYLMLGRMADRAPDTALIREWMALDWDTLYPGAAGADTRRRLDDHLTALLDPTLESLVPQAERAALRVDGNLVTRARAELARFPLADRVYSQVRRRGQAQELPEWRIVEAAGPEAARVFSRTSDQLLSQGVPGLYTYEGLHGFLLPALSDMARAAADESWVLGNQGGATPRAEDLTRLEDDVVTLYLNEYAAHWDRLVASVRSVPIGTGAEATLVLGILSSPVESPLRKLLTEMSRQTTLAKAPPDGSAGKAPGSPEARLQDVVGRPRTPEDGKLELARRIVDARFSALRNYVGGSGGPAPIDNTVRLMGDLYVQLSTTSQGAPGSPGGAAAVAAAQMLAADGARLPKPVSDIATGIVEDVNGIMKGVVQRDLNSAWRSDVLPVCRGIVANRYPVDATGPQDIAMGDFIRLFAPAGAIDTFFATHLQPYVDMSTRPWRLRPTGPTGIRVSREALLQLERAATVRDSFFPGGVRSPAVRFELTPMQLDPQATEVRLTIGSQSLSYNHGPQRPMTFQWPDPQGGSEARVSFNGASSPEGGPASGPWSLFKLIDTSARQVQSSDRMTVTFTAKSLSATFDLRASSVLNPFTTRALREFRCPETL